MDRLIASLLCFPYSQPPSCQLTWQNLHWENATVPDSLLPLNMKQCVSTLMKELVSVGMDEPSPQVGSAGLQLPLVHPPPL